MDKKTLDRNCVKVPDGRGLSSKVPVWTDWEEMETSMLEAAEQTPPRRRTGRLQWRLLLCRISAVLLQTVFHICRDSQRF